MSKDQYYLYTDGACQPNPGTGGWAFLIKNDDGIQIQECGYELDTTNNRMEMLAVIKGLSYYAEHIWTGNESVTLYSDSKYLVNGITIWCDGWHRRGWKKKSNKEVLNADLWQKLLCLRDMIKPECVHVRGHQGHQYNEIVDKLAFQAAKDAKSH